MHGVSSHSNANVAASVASDPIGPDVIVATGSVRSTRNVRVVRAPLAVGEGTPLAEGTCAFEVRASDAFLNTDATAATRSVVRYGDVLTYTITARNGGPLPAFSAAVRDPLPASLGSATWTCSAFDGASCVGAGSGSIDEFVTLPAGSRVVYTLVATVLDGPAGDVVNAVEVDVPPERNEADPPDNVAEDRDPIVLFGDGFE